MQIEKHSGMTFLKLSRRNLLTLLSKLDAPDSARTIIRQTGDGLFVVSVEEDTEHYHERPPGEVHPREEASVTFEEWRRAATAVLQEARDYLVGEWPLGSAEEPTKVGRLVGRLDALCPEEGGC